VRPARRASQVGRAPRSRRVRPQRRARAPDEPPPEPDGLDPEAVA
jgi:hypothetical protein